MKKQELVKKARNMGFDVNEEMTMKQIAEIVKTGLEKKEETTMNENTNQQVQEEQQVVEVKVAIFENIKTYLNAHPELLNEIKGMNQQEFNEWLPKNIDEMLTGSTEHVKKMSVDENLKKISKTLCADLAARAEMVDLTRKNAIRKGAEFFVSFLKWAMGVFVEVLRVIFKIAFCVVACIIKSLLCIPASVKDLFDKVEIASSEVADEAEKEIKKGTSLEIQ